MEPPRCPWGPEGENQMKAGEVKVERLDTACEGDKRQKVPFLLKWTCIKCGASHEHDYSGRYHLSYPIWGKPDETYLYCDKCEHEMPVTITPDVTMRAECD